MRPARIFRHPSAPPDPDALEPPPAWLRDARAHLSDAVASVGGAGPTVDSCITMACLLSGLEADPLPAPLVLPEVDGSVVANFAGADGRSVSVRCHGRSAIVSAWTGVGPSRCAFLVRDNNGLAVPGEPEAEGPRQQLRVAVAWATGAYGVPQWQVLRDAAEKRKAI